MQLAKDHARRRIVESFTGLGLDEEPESEPNFVVRQVRKKGSISQRKKRFSRTEIRHLIISSILVVLVSISLLGGPPIGILTGFARVAFFVAAGYWWYPTTIIVVFLGSFLVHEFAHKFTAQHFGMWSEFRMTSQGYYLSVIAILFSFPIFGTGVMYTSGTSDVEEAGKTNLAGPLSNSVIASVFAAISLVLVLLVGGVSLPFGFVVQYAIYLNSILGLFNMIPVEPFDGATVLRWSRSAWFVQTMVLLVLLVYAYFVLPGFLI